MSKIVYTRTVKDGIIKCYHNKSYIDIVENNNYIAIEPYHDIDGDAVCITMLDKSNNFLDGIILYEQDIWELIRYGKMQYNKLLTMQKHNCYERRNIVNKSKAMA